MKRREVFRRLGEVLTEYIEDATTSERMAIEEAIAIAREMAKTFHDPSYLDEKLSKLILDTCEAINDKAEFCKGGAREYAEMQKRLRLGIR